MTGSQRYEDMSELESSQDIYCTCGLNMYFVKLASAPLQHTSSKGQQQHELLLAADQCNQCVGHIVA